MSLKRANRPAFCWSAPPDVEIGVVRAHASLCEHCHGQAWGRSARARGTAVDSGVQVGLSAAWYLFLMAS